jgi:hypothetical protein
MPFPLCRHIKTNGIQCKSPALTSQVWCYFHARLHQRHTSFRFTDTTRGYLLPGQHVELTALEDRDSVQVALSVVVNALATGRLDPKRATALLYGLQLAGNNARHLSAPFSREVVLSHQSNPEGIDLAPAGATMEMRYLDEEDDDHEEEKDEADQQERQADALIAALLK